MSRRGAEVRRRRFAAVVLLVLGAVSGGLAFSEATEATSRQPRLATPSAAAHDGSAPAVKASPPASVAAPRPIARLVERPGPRLASALQDGASAALGGVVVVAGGLDAADASTADVVADRIRSVRRLKPLPTALHDAAAAAVGSAVYLFGGGNGVRQLDWIERIDPRIGAAGIVAHLPQPASDVAATAVAGTAYVVGGYTGTRWLATIVAWHPGRPARVVARLPTPLRYAAVAAVGGRIIIAGGSLPDGAASAAIYRYDPQTGAVRRLGSLPAPTTHAAAAALNGVVYVIGGRGAGADTPTRRIVAVDPRSGAVAAAGALGVARSDLAAAPLAGGIVLVGGRSPTGAVTTTSVLTPVASRPGSSRAPRHARASVTGVYAHTASGMLTGAARLALPRVYVPNSESGTVDVIDPASFRIVAQYKVGQLPQHVTPSWDMRTLYVDNDLGNSLTRFDPRTGRPSGRAIPVADPYNLYFTPDGRNAIVVAESRHRLDFRDPHSFRLHASLNVPCSGVNHLDFSTDGSHFLASCEFSRQLLWIGLRPRRVERTIGLPLGSVPQDVKLAPDGRLFYVADTGRGGVWLVSARSRRTLGFVRTGPGAHGLYPSRDSRFLYVTNRIAGTVSVIRFRTHRVVATWRIPGGSPDMGGVSADGRTFWVSGRYNAEVYAIDTRDGRLRARIHVGSGPHGLCVWPQPGRYSLGHTGVMR